MTGSIPDWPALFKHAFRCLRPGGYVESHEPSSMIRSDDGTVSEDSALARWGPLFAAAGEKSGRTFTVVDDGLQRKGMEEAGLVDIEERIIKAGYAYTILLSPCYISGFHPCCLPSAQEADFRLSATCIRSHRTAGLETRSQGSLGGIHSLRRSKTLKV